MPKEEYGYVISGLTVRAGFELPGVQPQQTLEGAADVVIRRGPVPDRLEQPVRRGLTWELDSRRFLWRLPGIGRMLATDGRTLDVHPESSTDLPDVLPFAMGTGFGAILLQRGGMVLHGSAVALEGRAYVFSGDSGVGKSTLAAALCQAGCTLITDDIGLIELDADARPVIWPDGRSLKLCEDSISHLSLAAQQEREVRAGTGKHFVAPAHAFSDGPVPLAAVYFLRSQRLRGEPLFRRLEPLDAAQTLGNGHYRPRLSLALARSSRQLSVTAGLLNHTPVFVLTHLRVLEGLESTVAQLFDHWRGLGK